MPISRSLLDLCVYDGETKQDIIGKCSFYKDLYKIKKSEYEKKAYFAYGTSLAIPIGFVAILSGMILVNNFHPRFVSNQIGIIGFARVGFVGHLSMYAAFKIRDSYYNNRDKMDFMQNKYDELLKKAELVEKENLDAINKLYSDHKLLCEFNDILEKD